MTITSSASVLEKLLKSHNASNSHRIALCAFGLPVAGVFLALLMASIFPVSGLAKWVNSYGAQTIFMLTLPLLMAWCIIFFKPTIIDNLETKYIQWVSLKYQNALASEKKLDERVFRPLFGGLLYIIAWADEKFTDSHIRQAVTLSLAAYFVALVIYIIMWVLVLVMLYWMLWALDHFGILEIPNIRR